VIFRQDALIIKAQPENPLKGGSRQNANVQLFFNITDGRAPHPANLQLFGAAPPSNVRLLRK
jgi:hypothetical protein